MKIGRLLFGTFLITAAISTYAQESDQERECKRMRFLAGEELKIKNYAAATTYYLKGENICGTYDKANYDRMVGTIRNAISTETDKARKTAYTDTLVGAYDRMEKAGHYDQANDLIRATYIIQSSKPERVKADELYSRAMHKEGAAPTEAHVSYYYYNLYVMFTEAAADKKPEYKKRLISEYFFLSKLITSLNMSVKTQENLLSYFNGSVKTCDDILPELKGYLKSLPTDVDAKKASVNNFISLLEMKSCTKSAEYGMLIDTLNRIDPSVDGKMAQSRYLRSVDKFNESIAKYKEAKSMTADADKKEECEYSIAEIQFNELKSYRAAYSTAMGITGKYRSSALKIAAQCVAQTANTCGSSTFERKCNYIYAAELADRAGDGAMAAKYRAAAPSQEEVFENGGAKTLTLSCWGVSVSVK
ncbi:MAG: hypothetical protein ACKOQ6_13690 [Bacteroidota bacterium]